MTMPLILVVNAVSCCISHTNGPGSFQGILCADMTILFVWSASALTCSCHQLCCTECMPLCSHMMDSDIPFVGEFIFDRFGVLGEFAAHSVLCWNVFSQFVDDAGVISVTSQLQDHSL